MDVRDSSHNNNHATCTHNNENIKDVSTNKMSYKSVLTRKVKENEDNKIEANKDKIEKQERENKN